MNYCQATKYISKIVREVRGDLSLRNFSAKTGLSHAYLQRIEDSASKGRPISITLSTLSKLIHAGIITNPDQLMEVLFSDVHCKP